MSYIDEADRKLDTKGKYGRRGDAMKGALRDRLMDFCRQDEEFAQAVAQGGSFADCLKEVEKRIIGDAISDDTAFGEAVRFYFPGAKIRVTMTLDLCGDAAETGAQAALESKQKGPMLIDLSEYF